MSNSPNRSNTFGFGNAQFTATHWSVILTARQGDTSECSAALDALCRTYWYPLYAYARRQGCDAAAAQDMTQGFFARLLEKDYLQAVDPRKGKFRSFLLAGMKHFLANEWRRSHVQKRGGSVRFISLDDTSAEQQYLQAPAAGLTPEKFFEQQWATTLLDQTISRLRGEFVSGGKETLFDELKIFLTGEKALSRYAELALKLQMTEAALKMAVSRMHQRYGELLRKEIANTVPTAADVEEELKALFAALST